MAPLYFEDLNPGDKFESRAYFLSTEEIKAFASQYDPQPFHLDEEAAKGTFFQGLAASGWHTAAIAMRLMVESIPMASGLIGAGVESLKWFKPVRPGDSLMLESEILSKRDSLSRPGHGIARVQHTIFNQHAEPVQRYIAAILVPKRL